MVIEGNVMKETHRDPNDASAAITTITRTFNNDEMIVVSSDIKPFFLAQNRYSGVVRNKLIGRLKTYNKSIP